MVDNNITLDSEDLVFSPICLNCKNYISFPKCKAFESIPMVIWNAENDHTKPFPGDNGIQFEPIKTNAN